MSEEPPSTSGAPLKVDDASIKTNGTPANAHGNGNGQRRGWLKSLMRGKEITLRDSWDELIDEREGDELPINESERALIENILKLRTQTVSDVMVPRADIVALEVQTTLDNAIDRMTSKGHSRMPVFRESLDDVVGMVHIKDLVVWRGDDTKFTLTKVQRPILFVSPSMQVLELLLEMRVSRTHMAIVVDEYGGVDGLLTIEDLVEEIVGEIDDEHDTTTEPIFLHRPDGSFEADARVEIDVLEETFGRFLSDDEREDIHTLGGLVFSLSGHIPIRGELVSHPAGFEFQILDADPRRIKRVRLRRITAASDGETQSDL